LTHDLIPGNGRSGAQGAAVKRDDGRELVGREPQSIVSFHALDDAKKRQRGAAETRPLAGQSNPIQADLEWLLMRLWRRSGGKLSYSRRMIAEPLWATGHFGVVPNSA